MRVRVASSGGSHRGGVRTPEPGAQPSVRPVGGAAGIAACRGTTSRPRHAKANAATASQPGSAFATARMPTSDPRMVPRAPRLPGVPPAGMILDGHERGRSAPRRIAHARTGGTSTGGVLPLVAAVVLGSGLTRPLHADEPPDAPAEPAAPVTPPAEPEMSPEEKAKYDVELKGHLKRLRAEKNKEMVQGTIDQLGSVGTRAARDALMQFATGNKNHEYLSYVFKSLAKIGGGPSIRFICGPVGVRSPDFLVQQSAVKALADAKDERAVEPLLEAVADPRVKIEVQGAIALTLAQTSPGNPKVIAIVNKLADDKRDTIRANAIEALGYLFTQDSFDRLLTTLKEDKNTRVRGAAATGLGHTKSPKAIAALQAAADGDKAFTVKDLAMKALKEIGATGK